MIEDLGGRVLNYARSLGFEDVAVETLEIKRTMVKIANSQPSVIQLWEGIDLSIYLAKNKRILVYNIKSDSADKVFAGVKNALSSISRLEESFLYAPLPEVDEKPKPLDGASDPVIRELISDPSDLTYKLINEAHENGADRVAGTLDLESVKRCLTTSTGLDICEDTTGIIAYMRAFSGDNSGHWGYASRILSEDEILEVPRKASEYATVSKGNTRIEPGRYDLILSPLVIGSLSNYIAYAASGLSKIMGVSFLARYRIDDDVAGEGFSLCDDPSRPDLYGSSGFDSEGVPTVRKCIIDSGRLKSFLHNSKTAAFLKEKTTGNAGWIMPHPFALTIGKGELEENELIEELKRGLIINNNWYTRLQNSVEGVFSTVTRDALLVVENGEIVGQSKRMRIADTFPNLLKNIELLSKRLYKVSWWEISTAIEAPYVLVRNINITRPSL